MPVSPHPVTSVSLTASAPPPRLQIAMHHPVHMSRNDRSSPGVSRPSTVREHDIVRCDECVIGTDDFPVDKATRTAQAETTRSSPPARPPRLPIWNNLGILSPSPGMNAPGPHRLVATFSIGRRDKHHAHLCQPSPGASRKRAQPCGWA